MVLVVGPIGRPSSFNAYSVLREILNTLALEMDI